MNDFFSLPQEKKEELVRRFESNIDKNGPDGCWLWTGVIYTSKRNGYGRLTMNAAKIDMAAHRFSWMYYYNSPIPGKLVCCHSCDVRLCVNPEHILMGTQKNNIKDCMLKDRRCPKYKRDMRIAMARDRHNGTTINDIKKKYSISPGTLYYHLRSKEIVEKFGQLVPM